MGTYTVSSREIFLHITMPHWVTNLLNFKV